MKKTYSGSCHCGQVTFEIQADIDHLRVCDCSVCQQRGALIHRVPQSDLHLLSSWDDLTIYKWGTMTAEDYFCSTCGVLPFRKPSALSEQEIKRGMEPFHGWAINARCLRGFDISNLPRVHIHGSDL